MVGFGVAFFLVAGTALLKINVLKKLNPDDLKPYQHILPGFLAVLFYFIAFYTVYRYYKNAPKIKVDGNTISFNKHTFALTEIEHADLTGKGKFQYFLNYPMEAATLHFRDGQTKYIFDDMYENAWEIKLFIKQVVVDKKDFAIPITLHIDKPELESEWYDTFRGNQFFSLRVGLLLYGIILIFSYRIATDSRAQTKGLLIFYILFCSFWFFLVSRLQMHFFQVSQNYFVVRNHNLAWRRKAYRLSDIKEIVFEQQGKMPNCLRVITNDFKSKLYPAATLRDKTWLALKDRLEHPGVKVRNECVSEKTAGSKILNNKS